MGVTDDTLVGVTDDKQIATLPPIEELHNEVVRSPRTGEPRRPAVLLVAAILLQLAVAATAIAYAHHWWLAVHPSSYPTSARLIAWIEPDPGKWLSLTLEAALAAATVLAAGAAGVAGFQAWNGWRWSRWAGLVAVGLVGGYLAITSTWVVPALALTVLGAALLFLPPVARYFRDQDRVRAEQPELYRRPERVFYGRLARFR